MVQIKNFLVVTMIWAIGMVALTATRAVIDQAPSSSPADTQTLAQRF
jgi:hypothetical protein